MSKWSRKTLTIDKCWRGYITNILRMCTFFTGKQLFKVNSVYSYIFLWSYDTYFRILTKSLNFDVIVQILLSSNLSLSRIIFIITITNRIITLSPLYLKEQYIKIYTSNLTSHWNSDTVWENNLGKSRATPSNIS